MKTDRTIQVIGRWVPEPMISAETLEGQQIFEVCADPTWYLRLHDRELAVYDGRNTHPRLRLRKVMRITPHLLSLEFSHWGRPWLPLITFHCWSDGTEVSFSHLSPGHTAMAISIGYPIYPAAKWVVSVERVA